MNQWLWAATVLTAALLPRARRRAARHPGGGGVRAGGRRLLLKAAIVPSVFWTADAYAVAPASVWILHNGLAGDYVAWPVTGLSVLGGLCAVLLQ
jgi:hypothetical protein